MTEQQQEYAIEQVSLGTIQASGPQDIILRATAVAGELSKIIKSQKLYSTISGKNFVRVEGWSTMGAMLGIVPREVSVIEHESGDFEATVELVRVSDGAVIGRASAIVGADEATWSKRPRYARRSMAVTRATGKAFRLGFSWIVTLAGFEPTPAEEMYEVIEAQVIEKPVVHQLPSLPPMTYDEACSVTNSKGEPYGELGIDKLGYMERAIWKQIDNNNLSPEELFELHRKVQAIETIRKHDEK